MFYRSAPQVTFDVRAYTELTTITGMATGSALDNIIVTHTTGTGVTGYDLHLLTIGYAQKGSADGVLDGIDRPGDLDGIPLSATSFSYVGGGVAVRATGGPFVVDSSAWTVPVEGQHPKRETLPQVHPSPTSGLVTSSGGACTLRYTIATSGLDANTYARAGAFGVFLDGLYGIGNGTIYDGTTSLGTISRGTLDYQLVGGIVRPQPSGSNAPEVWVSENELAGWQFETADGQVRTIRTNTEGFLGISPSGVTAHLYLESFDNSEDDSGQGYIYPSRMLLIVDAQGTETFDQLVLTFDAHTAFSEKRVGLVAAGPIFPLGRGVDANIGLNLEGGAALQTQPLGTRHRLLAQPLRRRMEVAIGNLSHVDSGALVYNDITQEPDYVRLSAHASARPAASRHGTPQAVRALYERAGRSPVVFLPTIPQAPASGDRLTQYLWRHTEGAIYGRLVSDFRKTMLQGRGGLRRAGWRTTPLAIEEEL